MRAVLKCDAGGKLRQKHLISPHSSRCEMIPFSQLFAGQTGEGVFAHFSL